MAAEMVISNSEMETFLDCPRKWYLTYYSNIVRTSEPIDSIAAREAGTEAHAGVEAYYTTGSEVAAYAVMQQRREEALSRLEDPTERKLWASKVGDVAHAMVEGYFQWLSETGADEGYRFTNIEETISAPSPVARVTIRGKMDHEMQRTDSGLYYVGDLKTSKDIDRPIRLANLGIPQALTYAWIQRVSNPLKIYVGGIWTILRQVKRGPSSKPPYFARHHVRMSSADIDAHEHNITGVIQRMKDTNDALDAGVSHQVVAYPHRTDSCLWKCPFVEVCSFVNRPGVVAEDLVEFNYEIADPNARYSGTVEAT